MLDEISKDAQVKLPLMTRKRTLVTGTLYGVSSVGRSNYTRNDQHQHISRYHDIKGGSWDSKDGDLEGGGA